MAVKEAELERFRTWLLDGGRSEGTARLYVYNVRRCFSDKSLTARLTGGDLEAKTKHTNKAALKAWADFSDDAELSKRILRVKLPPAERATAKRELEKTQWRQLVDSIRRAKLPDAVRATLLIISRRGLRIGDVLRIRRRDVLAGLRSGMFNAEIKGRWRLELSVAQLREPLQILADLTGWDRVEDLVTASKAGGIERRNQAAKVVSRALKRCAKKAGLDGVHPHRLRRTYAVHYLRQLAGDPQALVKLQRHMGWQNMATALKYVDAVDRTQLDALGDELVKVLDE